MPFLNVGAKTGNTDIPTKKALKVQVATDPTSVTFYVTDAFGDNAGKQFNADNLPEGYKLTVVGPNPYTSRKWYATVETTAKGVKVS